MGFGRVCIAVLLLQVWGAVWARTSGGAQADTATELSANLLDRNAIFSACSNPPDILTAPSEIAGDWCGLQNSEETNTTGPPASCNRVTFLAVSNHLRVILNSLENGRVIITKNVTFSQIANDSWLSRFDGRTTNFFVGLSADGKYLRTCGTTVVREGTPYVVNNMVLARCLGPGDEAAVAAGQRPDVQRCDLPQSA